MIKMSFSTRFQLGIHCNYSSQHIAYFSVSCEFSGSQTVHFDCWSLTMNAKQKELGNILQEYDITPYQAHKPRSTSLSSSLSSQNNAFAEVTSFLKINTIIIPHNQHNLR